MQRRFNSSRGSSAAPPRSTWSLQRPRPSFSSRPVTTNARITNFFQPQQPQQSPFNAARVCFSAAAERPTRAVPQTPVNDESSSHHSSQPNDWRCEEDSSGSGEARRGGSMLEQEGDDDESSGLVDYDGKAAKAFYQQFRDGMRSRRENQRVLDELFENIADDREKLLRALERERKQTARETIRAQSLTCRLQKLAAVNEALEAKVAELKEQLDAERKELLSRLSELEEGLQAERIHHEETRNDLTERREEIKRQNDSLLSRINESREKDKQLHEKNKQLNEKDRQIRQKDMRLNEKEGQLQAGKDELKELLRRYENEMENRSKAVDQLKNQQRHHQVEKAQHSKVADELQHLKGQYEAEKDKLTSVANEREELKRESFDQQQQITKLQTSLSNADQKCSQKEEEIKAVEECLISIRKTNELYLNSVSLGREIQKRHGIHLVWTKEVTGDTGMSREGAERLPHSRRIAMEVSLYAQIIRDVLSEAALREMVLTLHVATLSKPREKLKSACNRMKPFTSSIVVTAVHRARQYIVSIGNEVPSLQAFVQECESGRTANRDAIGCIQVQSQEVYSALMQCEDQLRKAEADLKATTAEQEVHVNALREQLQAAQHGCATLSHDVKQIKTKLLQASAEKMQAQQELDNCKKELVTVQENLEHSAEVAIDVRAKADARVKNAEAEVEAIREQLDVARAEKMSFEEKAQELEKTLSNYESAVDAQKATARDKDQDSVSKAKIPSLKKGSIKQQAQKFNSTTLSKSEELKRKLQDQTEDDAPSRIAAESVTGRKKPRISVIQPPQQGGNRNKRGRQKHVHISKESAENTAVVAPRRKSAKATSQKFVTGEASQREAIGSALEWFGDTDCEKNPSRGTRK